MRPGIVSGITGRVPDPEEMSNAAERESAVRALAYMGLAPGTPLQDIAIDRVFFGSCSNARIEDFRDAARILLGRHVAPTVRAIAVSGSIQVKAFAAVHFFGQFFGCTMFNFALRIFDQREYIAHAENEC